MQLTLNLMKVFGKIFLSILLIIIPIVLTYAQTEQYKFRHLTTKQGLPSNCVYSTIKDSDGFMWFATDNGFSRYDGYQIKVFLLPEDSLSNSQDVMKVIEDKDKNMWVATRERGLYKFNKIKESFTPFKNDTNNPKSLSHNSINTVYQDKMRILWVGTNGGGLNKFDPEREEFISYLNGSQKENNRKNRITTIYEDCSGIFWIGTLEGLFQFDRKRGIFHPFDFGMEIPAGRYRRINCIMEDIIGNIWIGTFWGVFKYDKNTGQISNYLPRDVWKYTGENSLAVSLSNLFVMSIKESVINKEHILWIATRWGLNKFDLINEQFEPIYSNPDIPQSISTNSLMELFMDDYRQLWIATSDGGVDILKTRPNPFKQVVMTTPDLKFRYSAASFLVDRKKTLWVGAIDEGILEFGQDLKFVSITKKWDFAPGNPNNNRINCIYEDSDNNLWLGFYEWGLILFEREQKTFKKIDLINNQEVPNPSTIDNIIQDNYGILWVGTNAGLYIKNMNEGILSPAAIIEHDELCSAKILRIYEDKKSNLWISTRNSGLFCLESDNRNSMEFVHYLGHQFDQNEFSGNYVYSIYEDQIGILWFGSDKGLNKFNFQTGKFEPDKRFNDEHAGPIIRIYEDDHAALWLFHATKGLIRYHPSADSKNNVKVFDVRDGLPFDKFNTYFSYINSFYQSADGRLFFSAAMGTGDGFFCFHPDSIKDNKKLPDVAITKMNIENKGFYSDTSILYKKDITLKHNQNFFSFEFAALDFMVPEKNQYAYYLEGFEENWNYSGSRRFANYTGVPPGEYTFRVKGSNNDGYWNETGTYVQISILPPFWKTWWAYCLYGLVFIGVIYSILRFYLRRQRLLYSLEIEQVETEKLKELDSLKTKFFTNISHEFRTPLTLILGPLQQLILKVNNPSDKQALSMVLQSANRLKDLVNQLLSLSKLESGKMKLQCTQTNIIAFVRNYVQSFESLAKHERIDLIFTSREKEIPVFLDEEKLAQVLNNLLSNAFKFTEEGGRIEISVTPLNLHTKGDNSESLISPLEGGRGVNISISDNGQGIPPEKLEHIFDRFYQADDSISREKEGTGIGLAIVKEMVNLHHGKIEAKSTIGKGTTFSIYLPLGGDHLKPDELKKSNDTEIEFEHTTFIQRKSDINETELTDEKGTDSSPSLLIVEDNPDMRTFIRGFFDNEFKILEAGDGQDGLKIAVNRIPDMIISDVMMPKMDGYEFCKKIKSDEKTSHIPVILLTARAAKESRLEGLEIGADDFITKPFDGEELQVRVKNLIEQRKKLSEIYRKDFEVIRKNQKVHIPSMDEKFLQKVKTVVEKNMSDPEYGVEKFASDMALSRFQLHRKLSALINQSITEFIRTIRLNYAIELLKKRTGTISEIAYDAGFNNPTYFSISFKKQFGISPKEYLNQLD